MKEIITLNFGQSGINIADSTLSIYLKQHGLHSQSPTKSIKDSSSLIDAKYNNVFFQENSKSISYRSIAVDCDPYSTNELLTHSNKQYYNRKRMITSNSSTGGLFSRGNSISQRQLLQQAEQVIQKTIESCDNFQGVMVNVSLLGGASGIFYNILGKIVGQEYLKKKVVVSNILFPSQSISNSIVQIYNYTLAFRTLLDYSHVNIPFDNASLYRMLQDSGVENPGYNELNLLIANMQSSMTLPFRSYGSLNNSLQDIQTNLVAYPRINLLYPSCSPLINSAINYSKNFSVDDLTTNIFDPRSRLLNMHGIYNKIAVGLYYRGDITPFQVISSLKRIKQSPGVNCKFQQWSPMGFKVGINHEQSLPYAVKKSTNLSYLPNRSCFSLTSSMQYNKLLEFNNIKFDYLYAKRAFVYSFIQDSMQEGEFSQARQNLAALEKDYEIWEGTTYADYEEQQ